MAFDSLSDRLNKTIRNIAGKGKLTDDNMDVEGSSSCTIRS